MICISLIILAVMVFGFREQVLENLAGQRATCFFIGFVLYFVVGTHLSSLESLFVVEHELTHVFFGLIFNQKVREIVINLIGKWGITKIIKSARSNPFISLIISLGPYFLPLFSLTLLGLSELLKSPLHLVAIGLTGALYANFLKYVISRYDRQPDVNKWRPVVSYPVILLGNILVFYLYKMFFF